MKHFEIFSYYDSCPLAVNIGRAVNTTEGLKSHIERCTKILGGTALMEAFFKLCIAYWAESSRYDDRNRYAVLASRQIVQKYPSLTQQATTDDDNLLKEAFAFTQCEHRYLQNELFKALMEHFRTKNEEFTTWFDAQNFVFWKDMMIPYEQYKSERYL